jgi:hypothetical protein
MLGSYYSLLSKYDAYILGLVWLPSFGAGIKEFIYDFSKYLFGCHEIGYGIHFEFHGFSFHA